MGTGTEVPCRTPGSYVVPSYFDVCNVSRMLYTWRNSCSHAGYQMRHFLVGFQLHILSYRTSAVRTGNKWGLPINSNTSDKHLQYYSHQCCKNPIAVITSWFLKISQFWLIRYTDNKNDIKKFEQAWISVIFSLSFINARISYYFLQNLK